MKLRYSDFVSQIDIDALESAIGFTPTSQYNNEDTGRCPDIWGLHKHGDTTGKFSINREKKVYNCWVCFPGDTPVRTIDGFKDIRWIRAGDRVLSDDGIYHKVNAVIENQYSDAMVRIESPALSETLYATLEHPFKVYRNNKFEWISAKDLTRDDYLVVQEPLIKRSSIDNIEIPEEYLVQRKYGPMRKGPREFRLTKDFLWIIGLYLAEGHAEKRHICFSLHSKETEYQAKLKLFFEAHGYSVTIKTREDKPNSAWVLVFSSVLAEWFPEWLGRGCQNKKIPSELLDLPNDKAGCILQGLMDGDGSLKRDSLRTTSRQLAMQMVTLMRRDNGFPSISVEYPLEKKPVYTVENVIGVLSRRSQFPRNQKLINETWLSKVTKVETKTVFVGPVYNLSVDKNPTYTVDNVVVHNCGGGSLLSLAISINDMDAYAATEWLYQFANDEEIKGNELEDQLQSIFDQSNAASNTAAMPYFNEKVLDRYESTYDSWFAERGITKEAQESFGARLSRSHEKKSKQGEVYHGRAIILPHYWETDSGFRLVGWQARWLDEDRPKWVNKYTNTPGFPREETLFNYWACVTDLELPPIVIVESVSTVMFLESYGIPAIATFGGTVTGIQMSLLKVFHQGVILAADNDAPGLKWRGKLTNYLQDYIPVWWIPLIGEKNSGNDLGNLAPDYKAAIDHIDNRFLPLEAELKLAFNI